MLGKLFGSRLRAKALGWLVSHPDERFYVRQLHSILGEDATNLGRELARLAEMGILTCTVEGLQKYYEVNKGCPIFGELQGIAIKTSGVADVLRSCLDGLRDRINFAFVYGSVARGRLSIDSDVDVLVVGDVSFGEVVAGLSEAQLKLGREVNPSVYPRAEFRAKLAAGHHFIKAVMSGPKVFLIGDGRELAGLAKKRLAHRP